MIDYVHKNSNLVITLVHVHTAWKLWTAMPIARQTLRIIDSRESSSQETYCDLRQTSGVLPILSTSTAFVCSCLSPSLVIVFSSSGCVPYTGLSPGAHRVRAIAREKFTGGKRFRSKFFDFTTE